MNRKLAFAISMLLILSAAALAAQSDDTGTRSVQGVVTDASGQLAAGTVVQLKDTKSLQIRSYRTEADGAYHFAGLSTNVEYELEARNDTATSGKKTLSIFNTNKAATVNLKLRK